MFFSILKLFLLLNSNKRPWQVSGAVAYGLLLAMVPANNLLWFVLFFLLFFLKVNRAVGLLFTLIFGLFSNLYDPLLDRVGYFLLTLPSLQSFWTGLYRIPLIPFTRFNNSLVMGGLVTGLLLFIPVTLLFTGLVILYRKKIAPKIKETKVYRYLNSLKWVKALRSVGAKASSAIRLQKGV